ncbi:UNVERIFIED_CONTAM: hypothetical protein PYX00_000660 [Menopon gallinae]|uniref:Uncharacterized protein n=1 Tax=Menopon gallinae TaxID=328185 RepID=A0AAW2IA47_9NEOP
MLMVSLLFTLFSFVSSLDVQHFSQGLGGLNGSGQKNVTTAIQPRRNIAVGGPGQFPQTWARFLQYRSGTPASQNFYRIYVRDSPTFQISQYVQGRDEAKGEALEKEAKGVTEEPNVSVRTTTEKRLEKLRRTTTPRPRRKYGKHTQEYMRRRKLIRDY